MTLEYDYDGTKMKDWTKDRLILSLKINNKRLKEFEESPFYKLYQICDDLEYRLRRLEGQ